MTLHAYLNSERATEEYIRFIKQLQTNRLVAASQKSYRTYFTISKVNNKVLSLSECEE